MTRAEQFGYFLNDGKGDNPQGVEMGLPIRWERTPRFALGYLPCWPFTRWPFQTDKAIYRAKLIMEHPLTFVCGTEFAKIGVAARARIQICKVVETDGGSIPTMFQPLYAKDSFPCSFLHHDSAYVAGGMWFSEPGSEDWHFGPMTREEVEWMLYCMVGAEGGDAVDRSAIYHAVWLGGWLVWKHC